MASTKPKRRDAVRVFHLKGCPRTRDVPPRYDADGRIVAEAGTLDGTESYVMTDPSGRHRRITRCQICGAHAVDGIPLEGTEEDIDAEGDDETP